MGQRNNERPDQLIVRRNVLKGMAVVGGSATFAGCIGDDDDVDDTDDTDDVDDTDDDDGPGPGEERIDDTFTAETSGMEPEHVQFNPYNPSNEWGTSDLNHQYAHWLQADGEFEPRLATDWEHVDDRFVLHLREDHTWTNGDELTADDVDAQYRIDEAINQVQGAEFDFISDWDVVDEKTVEFVQIEPELNDTIFELELLEQNLYVNRNFWADTLDQIEDAADDAALEEIVEEDILNRRIEGEELVSNGFWAFSEVVGDQSLLYEARDDHWWADDNDTPYFEEFEIAEGWQEAMEAGDLDWGGNNQVTDEVALAMPDNLERAFVPRDIFEGWIFKGNDEWWGRRNIRKAFAYIGNFSEIATAVGLTAPPPNECGLHQPGKRQSYIGEDVLDQFEEYGWDDPRSDITQDEAWSRAEALLEEEGLTKEGDLWVKPDGEVLSPDIMYISTWDVMAQMHQMLSHTLQEFGLGHEIRAIEVNTFFEQNWEDGDFEIIFTQPHGGSPHPWGEYNYWWNDDPGSDSNTILEGPQEVEVPMPIGDPDGSLETVNVPELTAELRLAEGQREREICQELGWIFNQTLPGVAAQVIVLQDWYNNAKWDYPEIDVWEDGSTAGRQLEGTPEEFHNYRPYDLLGKGIVRPKYE